jgi:hypothetical protein
VAIATEVSTGMNERSVFSRSVAPTIASRAAAMASREINSQWSFLRMC